MSYLSSFSEKLLCRVITYRKIDTPLQSKTYLIEARGPVIPRLGFSIDLFKTPVCH